MHLIYFTNISVTLFLSSEGVPTKTIDLCYIFLDFNDAYGVVASEVEALLTIIASDRSKEYYQNYCSVGCSKRIF